MAPDLFWWLLTALVGLGAAACGGAFLTFSTLTTGGLARLPEDAGMAAMQQINAAAVRSPAFLVVLFGPSAAGLVLVARALTDWAGGSSALVVAGVALHLLGVGVMTMAFHVPRNDDLASRQPVVGTGWPGWLRGWVAGNHVRTLSGLLAGALLLASLLR